MSEDKHGLASLSSLGLSEKQGPEVETGREELNLRQGHLSGQELGTSKKHGNNNPVYETAKETLMYRTVLWTLWERERVGRFGRMAFKHVKYHV